MPSDRGRVMWAVVMAAAVAVLAAAVRPAAAWTDYTLNATAGDYWDSATVSNRVNIGGNTIDLVNGDTVKIAGTYRVSTAARRIKLNALSSVIITAADVQDPPNAVVTGAASLGAWTNSTTDVYWIEPGDGLDIQLLDYKFTGGTTHSSGAPTSCIRKAGAKGAVDGTTYTGGTGAQTNYLCTLTYAGGQPFVVGERVTVSGASVAGYNGTWIVTAATGTTLSYVALTGSLATCTGAAVVLAEDAFWYDTAATPDRLWVRCKGLGTTAIASGDMEWSGNSTASSVLFFASGCDQLTISGLEFNRAAPMDASDGDAISISTSTNVTISGCGFHRNGDHHIYIGSTGPARSTTITGCRFYDLGKPTGDSSVVFYTTSGNVSGCVVQDSTFYMSLPLARYQPGPSDCEPVACVNWAANSGHPGYSNGLWAVTAHVNTPNTDFVSDVLVQRCTFTWNPRSWNRDAMLDSGARGARGFPGNNAVADFAVGRNTLAITGDPWDWAAYPFRVRDCASYNQPLNNATSAGANNAYTRCKVFLSGVPSPLDGIPSGVTTGTVALQYATSDSATSVAQYNVQGGSLGITSAGVSNVNQLWQSCLITIHGQQWNGYGSSSGIRVERDTSATGNRLRFDSCTIASAQDNSSGYGSSLIEIGNIGTPITTAQQSNNLEMRRCVLWRGGATGASSSDLGIMNSLGTHASVAEAETSVRMRQCWIYGWPSNRMATVQLPAALRSTGVAGGWGVTDGSTSGYNPGGIYTDPAPFPSATVTLSRTSGLVTGTAVAHGLRVNDPIFITGASPVSFNFGAVVQSVPTADTFTYRSVGADGAATGTITMYYLDREPAAGAAVRSTTVTGTGDMVWGLNKRFGLHYGALRFGSPTTPPGVSPTRVLIPF